MFGYELWTFGDICGQPEDEIGAEDSRTEKRKAPKFSAIVGSPAAYPTFGLAALRSVQRRPDREAPAKKGGEKTGCSAADKVVTQEHTICIRKHIHGVGFKKCALRELREIWKFAPQPF
ncbi:60S ribosomal protein L31 [Tupaia chinensis]|uniref:60S ribosomal protein L31 n=1 Tax=Tupaia chinensis TaxID=246437 RepID=L9JGA6_TUPCH|nr:60S ribosomal protein L31 [Tupaia chinensis]